MFNPRSLGVPDFGNVAIMPPSMVPQIRSVGDTIDAFIENRRRQAQEARAAAALKLQQDRLQAQEERDAAALKEREAYGRRKQDLAEKKQEADELFRRTKENRATIDPLMRSIGQGKAPGSILLYDESGQPFISQPRFEQYQEEPPQLGPVASPVPSPGVGQEAILSARKVFVDEPGGDEESQIVVENPDGTTEIRMVPPGTLPPGAQEGSRLDYESVFPSPPPSAAPPIPSLPQGPPAVQPSQPTPQLRPQDITPAAMPGSIDAAMLASAPRPAAPAAPVKKRGRWVIPMPGGEPMVVDMETARQAHLDEVRSQIQSIEEAMGSPGMTQDGAIYLARKKAILLADLPPEDQRSIMRQQGAMDIAGINAIERQADRASREKIAEMRGKKRINAMLAAGGGPLPAGELDEAYARLPQKLANPTAQQVRSILALETRTLNWAKLIGVGTNRLALAERNITLEGPDSGTAHVESMMNFFGYIRGGVPAKNETVEWRHMTGNAINTLDSIGLYFKLGPIGSYISNTDLSEEEKRKLAKDLDSRMTPGQRRSLQKAIHESRSALLTYAEKDSDAMAESFRHGTTAEQAKAADMINSLRTGAGLKRKDYFKFWGKRATSPEEYNVETKEKPTGKMTLDEALKAMEGR